MSQIEERLQAQLQVEKDAIELYNSFLQRIEDESVRSKIARIRDDEIEHVGLVEEMISVFGKQGHSEVSEEKGGTSLLRGFIEEFSSLLVQTDLEKYAKSALDIVKESDMRCIYISFNKLPKYIKKLVLDHGVDASKLSFISCVSVPGDDVVVDPRNLIELSVTLAKTVNEVEGRFFVLVDSISAFTVYHTVDVILKFVSSLNSKLAQQNSGVVWLAVGEESEELAGKVGQLCDKVVRL